MKLHELYISKAKRDARWKELKVQGKTVHRSLVGRQYIHPQYVQDYTGIEKTDTAVGNLVYKMFFPMLYVVEEI